MKKECGIIQDLLPLYKDEVCSNESREFVEKHIKTCPDCANELEKMKEDIAYQSNTNDADAIRAIALKWKSNKKIFFLIGSFFVSLATSIGCAVSYNIQGSYIDANGFLVEPFYLIPLSLLFGLFAIIFFIALCVTILVRYIRMRRLLRTI